MSDLLPETINVTEIKRSDPYGGDIAILTGGAYLWANAGVEYVRKDVADKKAKSAYRRGATRTRNAMLKQGDE